MGHMQPPPPTTVALTHVKERLSTLVAQARNGAFITITRHGKPVAALAPTEAADLARETPARQRHSLVAHLATFPGAAADRNPSPSRDADL